MRQNKSATQFVFYFRENCHLCESMRLALLRLQKSLDFTWIEIDIDRETELIRLYDGLVPVLQYQEQEVFHFFIDEEKIREIITDRNG